MSSRKEVQTIRDEIPDSSIFLTAEESELVDASFKHETGGDLISSKTLRKELGL